MRRAAAVQLGHTRKSLAAPRGPAFSPKIGVVARMRLFAPAMSADKTLTSVAMSSLSDRLIASAHLCWLSIGELEGAAVSNALLLMAVVAPPEFLVKARVLQVQMFRRRMACSTNHDLIGRS
jgi:hypothetical protein